MSSVLLNLFDITHLNDVKVNVDAHSIFIKGVLDSKLSCPRCGGEHLNKKAKNHRVLRLPPVCGKIGQLQVLVQKQLCVNCNYCWWPKIPFSNGKERITTSFISYALNLLRFGTIKDVSEHLNASWDIIKAIHKKYLKQKYKEIDVSDVEYVSIDEFSVSRGHKYFTIIVDIRSGRIIYAVEGRKKNEIAPILKELKKKHPNLKLLPWI